MRTTNKPPNVPADAPADDMLTGLLARYNRAVRRALVDTIDAHDTSNPFYGIMRYHLGLADARLQPIDAPSGKGLRGALLMLTAAACGGAERDILPLAAPLGAAVEFLHSFSLVHDDIEDGSATRRHRATVWAIWGAPIGINAGDGLYALAHLALFRSPLRETNPTAFIDVMHTFETATLRLAEGQHRDMALQDERVANVSVEDYLGMIEGKTATLIGAAAAIGARAAGADAHRVDAAARFGRELGMAFQMQDDILGIWGDERVTGKSAVSDITSRKKTLPILLALAHSAPTDRARLDALYAQHSNGDGDTGEILALLDRANARGLTRDYLRRYREAALHALTTAHLDDAALAPLRTFEQRFTERTA